MHRQEALPDEPRATRRGAVRVMCLALMMVVGAVADLNVALPEIARSTGASQTQLQWIVAAYALAFAALLLPAGAIEGIDRLAGNWPWPWASPTSASPRWRQSLPERPRRADRAPRRDGCRRRDDHAGDAVGDRHSLPAPRNAARQSVPGLVSPPAAASLACSPPASCSMASLAVDLRPQRRPRSRRAPRHARDRAGHARSAAAPARPRRLAPSAAGLAALVFGVIEGPERGWGEPTTVLSLAFGAVSAVAFVLSCAAASRCSTRGTSPGAASPRERSRTVQFLAAFGFLFLALPYLQLVIGYSPLQAAEALVPMALVVIPLSRIAPAIAANSSVSPVRRLSLMAFGFIVLATLKVGSSYAHFLAGLLPFGAGMALAGAPATTAIVASLPRSNRVSPPPSTTSPASSACAGIAVLGSLMNGVYPRRDGRLEREPFRRSRREGARVARCGPADRRAAGAQGHQLALHAQAAFLHGFTRGLIGGAWSCSSAPSTSPSGPPAAPSPGRMRPGSRSAPLRKSA